MVFGDIFELKLNKNNFVKLEPKNHYSLVFFDKTNYQQHINDINKIINLIKIDISDWKESPDLDNVLERLKSNSHCLLFYFDDECIGWNWSNKNVSFDWINTNQKLNDNELYVGGFFVSKSVNRPADAGRYNYNMVCDYWLNKMGYVTVYGYVDKWNKPSIRVCLQTGVKFVNYLNI
jgi:hypothetical protein